MLRNLATALIENGRIETTISRAKDTRRIVEKLITKGKKGNLHGIRLVSSFLKSDDAVKKVCTTLKDQYAERNGGYTRILKNGHRANDGATVAILELV